MEFKEGEITVSTPCDVYPQHTKTFVSLLLRMINKGIDNPAYQLHALALICTGKSFMELLVRNSGDAEHMLEAARAMADSMLDTIAQSSNMSQTTIEDMLDKYGKKGRNFGNTEDEE